MNYLPFLLVMPLKARVVKPVEESLNSEDLSEFLNNFGINVNEVFTSPILPKKNTVRRWENAYSNPIKYKLIENEFTPKSFLGTSKTRELRRAIQTALNLWEQAADLRFVEVADDSMAEIKISFQKRDHGDGSNFDGPQNTVK